MADPNGLKLYTLFDLSSEYPVGIRICHFLSIADIIALTRTCRTLSSLYKSLIPSQWNLNSRLQPFVDNVTGFRSEMAKCDALISGSFALQFFDRTLWPRSDLDINVRNSAEQFERYLRNVEGYKLLRSTEGKNYDMVGVDKILTMIRRLPNAAHTEIQLCISTGLPVEQILTGFYSTHVTNFITWDKAYSLFPVSTLLKKKGYMLQKLDEHTGEHLAKYQKRGWRIQDVIWDGEDPVRELEGLRRIGDQYTWAIELDTTNVKPSKTPDYVFELASFRLAKDANSDWENESHLEHYQVSTTRVAAKVLKYKYLSGSPEWSKILTARTNRLTEIELFKDDTNRSPDFRNMICNPSSDGWKDFRKSRKWTYYDREVPKWYEQWLRMRGEDTVREEW